MTFSLIIPAYNVAPYIKECLDSVLSQSYQDWEAICVDDGSTDETGEICEKFAEQVRGERLEVSGRARIKVIHQPNGGLSVARNTGVHHATGDYLLFLDSDDVLTSDALAMLKEQIDKYQPDVITFNAELWYAQEGRRQTHYYNRETNTVHTSGRDYLVSFVQKHHWGPAAACFYCVKRSVVMDNKLWFQPHLLHEDELWVPMMLLHSNQTVVEEAKTLYLYRMRSGSIMHMENEKACMDKLYIGATLEEELSKYALPTAIKRYIVLNNVRHGLYGLKVLGRKLPMPDLLRAFRNANWKQKIRILWQLVRLEARGN